jgi:hypothetical protein
MKLFNFINHSLLASSGQLWKLGVATLALLFGSFAPLYPALSISWAVGSVIAFVGYAFGLIFIRCTNCANRWLWEATKGNTEYSLLFKPSPCPNCQHDFE